MGQVLHLEGLSGCSVADDHPAGRGPALAQSRKRMTIVFVLVYPTLKPITPEGSIDAELLALKISNLRNVEEPLALLEASLLREEKV